MTLCWMILESPVLVQSQLEFQYYFINACVNVAQICFNVNVAQICFNVNVAQI